MYTLAKKSCGCFNILLPFRHVTHCWPLPGSFFYRYPHALSRLTFSPLTLADCCNTVHMSYACGALGPGECVPGIRVYLLGAKRVMHISNVASILTSSLIFFSTAYRLFLLRGVIPLRPFMRSFVCAECAALLRCWFTVSLRVDPLLDTSSTLVTFMPSFWMR